MRGTARLALCVVTSVACATGRGSGTGTSSCPIPAEARGYPVSASSANQQLTPQFLRTVARAVAGHWATDDDHWQVHDQLSVAMQRMAATFDQGDSFSRDEWQPSAGDSATLLLVYRGDTKPEVRPSHARRTTRFESRALRAVQMAIERSAAGRVMRDTLPLTAPGTLDSTVVVVAFGKEPDARGGVARFAAQERRVRLLPGGTRPSLPPTVMPFRDGRVHIAFVVLPDSTVDLSTVHVIESSDAVLSSAVLHALPGSRYSPAQIDCRTVPMLVTQPYVFKSRQNWHPLPDASRM